jgi:hypothetical protein
MLIWTLSPEIASRVEIDVIGQYLKPYLDTIVVEGLESKRAKNGYVS